MSAPADAGRSWDERYASLLELLRAELVPLMGLASPSDLDIDTGLFDLGLTSAMVVQLRARVEEAIGREVPTTAVFNHPTVSRLAAFLADSPAGAPVRNGWTASQDAEPIAIVGMACRFPGGANDLGSFWQLLARGGDAVGDVPANRWEHAAFYSPDPDSAGKTYSRYGGFLDVRVDEFDADAFGISPREARGMDPQQRLLLEVAWEALEDAGYPAESVAGSATGVYVGINTSDYMQLLSAQGTGEIDSYLATGNTFSTAAGRLSYFLGTTGPSMAVDTACSSSLVGAHLASQSLRAREVDMAIVAGVNLMLSPATTVSLAKLRALSPDGRCKTFDASADGYGRGEGCGVIMLKRLSDAVAAGDRVWAVLRGSAVNQDGRSAGLTVPNGDAQEAVIREALRSGGVEPAAVSYVEAHGTGTSLGDPLEIGALLNVLRPDGGDPLVVGSVKTNVGHLEAAAGVCGLIKTALALHHREIPPHLHFRTPNPLIRWDEVPVVIARDLMPWTTSGPSRLAGISSFGFSGTNAHVVLEEAPPGYRAEPLPAGSGSAPPAGGDRAELLVLSARTPEALPDLARSYARTLDGAEDAAGTPVLGEVAAAAALRRSHLPARMALVAKSGSDAAERLAAVADGRPADGVRTGQVRSADRPRVTFVFSGQGAQWAGMGGSLLTEPGCAWILSRCDEIIRELADWSLTKELTAGPGQSRLDDTSIAQPAIFAIQAALTELWRSWGVEPDAVVGHSVGEIAAAYAAGVLDLDSAARVAVYRGQVMRASRDRGAMATVGLPEDTVRELIGGWAGRLWIAAVNSHVNTVVAGDRAALAELEAAVRGSGAFWATVQAEYAFHTPLMEPERELLASTLGEVSRQPAARLIVSTVTGQAAGPEAFGARYWADGMVAPVRFSEALRAAVRGGHDAIVEIGPHPALATAVTQSLEGQVRQLTVLASMRSGRDGRATMLDAVGGLYTAGARLSHENMHSTDGRRADLPRYPWQRARYWLPGAPRTAAAVTSVASADQADQALTELTYEIQWQPLPPLVAPAADTPGTGATWIILAGPDDLARSVAVRIEAAGPANEVIRVAADPACPPDPDSWLDLLARAMADATHPVRGVIHLGTLASDCAAREPGAELDHALALSCAPLLGAARLAGSGEGDGPRFWTVTRGGVAVGDCVPALSHAPVWGLGRVLALERPELWGGIIDLDPRFRDAERDGDLIAAEVLHPDGEDQVAYRVGERLVARLERAALPAESGARPQISPAGAYLVTGGRGSLGLRIARWLADNGARHLVLLGRRPLPAAGASCSESDRRALRAIEELRAAGIEVHLPSADVADQAAMSEVFAQTAPWPAIRGIVHAAGVSEPRDIAGTDWDSFRRVLRPKVEGSLILDALAGSADMIDFFVLFSSASSVWGSALAGHYAAANHFEDVLAFDRVRRGVSAIAVNWGWWAGSEMALLHGEYFASMGLTALPDEQGFAVLNRLFAPTPAQITVAPVDWARFRPVMEARRRRPLLERMGTGAARAVATVHPLAERLAGSAAPAARRRLAEDAVQAELAAVLGRDPGSRLDPATGFFDAGMDSITSVEFKSRLESITGAALPATVAFDYPTIARICEYLLTEVLAAPADSQMLVPPGTALDLTDETAHLSEDELLALLSAELDQGGTSS